MSRQILKHFQTQLRLSDIVFLFFVENIGWQTNSFISNYLSLFFQFPVTRNNCGDFMEGVAPQENLCFFHLWFPFLSTKKVSLGLILSYKDSLKIIRVSQLWTNPAIST